MLRARKVRREQSLEASLPESITTEIGGIDPEEEAELADSVGLALLVVLDTLAPAERLAFVLHDLFGVSFEEIAPIVERSPAAARQLASRARRRIQGQSPTAEADRARQRVVVDAFLSASRGGDFEALLTLLDPDVVFRGDEAAERMGGTGELHGARFVAEQFCGRAQGAHPALLDGEFGFRVSHGDEVLLVVHLGFRDGRISEIEAVADRATIAGMELVALDG